MFEGLRKKLSDAVKGFIKKEETKVETAEKQEEHIEKAEEPETIEVVEEKHEEPVVEKKIHVEGKKNEVQEKEEVVHEKKEIQKPGKEELIKLSLTTKIKSVFLGTIRLSETEIDPFLETLKVSMLESDVSYDTTDYFIDDLHSKLSEKRISSRKIKEEITDTVRGSLLSVLQSTNAVNMDEFVSSHKSAGNLPVKLLFLGPNGAGKTTTIAKMAHRFKEKGMTTVLSASDTFRAAAIEQIEHVIRVSRFDETYLDRVWLGLEPPRLDLPLRGGGKKKPQDCCRKHELQDSHSNPLRCKQAAHKLSISRNFRDWRRDELTRGPPRRWMM